MLDIYLQDALVEEVKSVLSGYHSWNKKKEYSVVNVYAQELPKKRTKEEKEPFPYVLVCLDEENIVDIESDFNVKIYFLIGTYDDDAECQGHRDVLNISNKIYQHFVQKRFIQDRYKIIYPINIKLQTENETFPYYYGVLFTNWKLEKMEQEEDEFI
ncbi:MAG: hypothetical protein ACERKN_07110 [Velocimicrobium sp.]